MDHGVLNVPLAKRGNIDKQVDAYKAEQAAAARASEKAARKAHRAARPEADRILAAIFARPDLLAAKAAATGRTVSEVRGALKSLAISRPAAMPAFERDWLNA